MRDDFCLFYIVINQLCATLLPRDVSVFERGVCFAAISSMLHAGCGVGGRLAADLEFADGVVCHDGSVSDVTWRENRCEPTSSLTVTMSARCRRYDRPHHSATLGKVRQFSAITH